MSEAPKTEQEIRGTLDELAQKKIEIDGQISEAKRNFASGGEPASVDWLRRAEYASRMTGRDIQYWQGELGRVRKEKKQAYAVKVESGFVQCAREILPSETFAQIMRAAIDAARSAGGDDEA